ncbi:ribonuclease H-like protein [Peniophora sp. CONT]|nr:ribonuclease H-like protein [Peniophora sp. CONT]
MAGSLVRAQTTQAIQAIQPQPPYTIASRTPVPAVIYISTSQELDAALEDFQGPYGFDCEWKCMPESGRIALIQLSNGSKVLLIHVFAMSEFPVQLKALLEDVSIAKVGVFVEGDGKRLREEYGVVSRNLVNLGPLAWCIDANFRTLYRQRGTSLANTVIHFLQRVLPKGPVRLSNWERVPLTDAQREYAAGDAHCALEIYRLLLTQAASNNIDLRHCGHVVDLDTVIVYEFPDNYPLDQHRAPSGLTSNEYHAYTMWYHGYSSGDIQRTMARYQVPAHPTDETAVISLLVGALTKDITLPFQAAALRALVENDPVAVKQHEAFLAARCPVAFSIVPAVEPQPAASISRPALAGKKRNTRAHDETESTNEPGAARDSADMQAATPVLRRSARQAASSRKPNERAVKRRRTARF